MTSIWSRLEDRSILRRAREDLGLSQEEFAERIDRKGQWISQCERGVSLLSDVDIGKIRGVHPEAHAELSKRRLRETMRMLQVHDDGAVPTERALDVALVRSQVSQANALLSQAIGVLDQTTDA